MPKQDTLWFEKPFAGRSVLVTGHTGFTGSWLSLWLERIGARVTGLALPPLTTPNLYEDASVDSAVTSIIGDIREAATVHEAMEKARPEVVFHLAAQPLVSRSFDDPLETYATNVMGTAHVLEAARTVPGVRAVVCITTDKVYRDQDWNWGYRENDALGGKDPYSASKACCELVAASYRASMAERGNKVRIATARGGNIIGGGDWSDNRIVPDFVRSLIDTRALELRNPASVRPWQHVLALAHGYMVLANALLSDTPPSEAAYNFGPGGEGAKPVSDLIDAMQRHWAPISVKTGTGSFPETSFLHLDSSKARRDLRWNPGLDFEGTVAMTAQWYRRNHEKSDIARSITLEQIDSYRQAVAAAT